MKKKTLSKLDKTGILCSGACALHCLAAPLMISLSPVLGSFFENEWVHRILLITIIPLALFSFLSQKRIHKSSTPLYLGILGMACLCSAVLGEAIIEHFPHELEIFLTSLGSIILIAGHLFNMKKLRFALAALLLFFSTVGEGQYSYAQSKDKEKHNLGAHEHGAVHLEMTYETTNGQGQFLIMMKGPAESIIGFEHKPKTKTQEVTIAKAKDLWEKDIFSLLRSKKNDNTLHDCKIEKSVWKAIFEDSGHAEIDAKASLNCKSPMKGRVLSIVLKKVYTDIKEVHIELLREDNTVVNKEFTTDIIQLEL